MNPLVTIFYRIHSKAITTAARAVWENQKIADEIASHALQILELASQTNLRFFSGKPPKCILGGLFYILGFKFNAATTQREIADLLCTTEFSVSSSYKNWLIEFPQFFQDIKTLKLPMSIREERVLFCLK